MNNKKFGKISSIFVVLCLIILSINQVIAENNISEKSDDLCFGFSFLHIGRKLFSNESNQL